MQRTCRKMPAYPHTRCALMSLLLAALPSWSASGGSGLALCRAAVAAGCCRASRRAASAFAAASFHGTTLAIASSSAFCVVISELQSGGAKGAWEPRGAGVPAGTLAETSAGVSPAGGAREACAVRL